MNEDGTGVTQLTTDLDAFNAAWSPDGTRIAFTRIINGAFDIFVMNADGTGVTKLTSSSPASSRKPVWCRDRIAFYSDREGDNDPTWSPSCGQIAFTSKRDGFWQIYVINADGTGEKRLSDARASDEFPAWSPDGSRIAFTSSRDGYYEIYVINADGTGLTRLTGDTAGNRFAEWSPDGRRIAFTSDRGGSDDVYVMNADGTNVIRVTNDRATDWGPAWRR